MVVDGNSAPKYPENAPSTDAPTVPVPAPLESVPPAGRRLDPPARFAPALAEGGPAPAPFSFGPAPPRPCSVCRCPAGHEWIPQFRLTACPGCHAPMLVLLMQQCPVCNEPTAATDLRLDHMPQASGQLLPICRGSATFAEALKIELRHQHAQDEEARHEVREVVSKA